MLSVFIWISVLSINAQDSIMVSIEKEIEDGQIFINVSIKNNNSDTIVIFAGGEWQMDGSYLERPTSYLQFIGNPSQADEKETGHLILTTKIVPGYAIRTRISNFLQIKPGETKRQRYLLFGEQYFQPLRTFYSYDVQQIRTVQAKVTIRYLYHLNWERHGKILYSNILTL